MEIQMALAAVKLSVARPLIRNWNKKGIGVKAIRKFLPKGSKGYRLYIPIAAEKSPKVVPPPAILHAITSAGYKIDDYITGIAVDSTGKRRVRMGKLLKDAALLKAFSNDPQRAAHKDEFTCVISCHPYDVLSMSTGRRWDMTSCMRLDVPGVAKGGMHKDKVRHDIAEGTLVAYAISPNDKNIEKPHARLLIKPFIKSEKGGKGQNVYFRVESSIYGTPIPGFKETVSAWLRKVNKGADHGLYTMPTNLYNDGVGLSTMVGKFEEIKDKWDFIQRHEELDGGIDHMFKEDKRWIGAVFKTAEKISIYPDRAANDVENKITKAQRAGIKDAYIGAQIDENLPDKVLYALNDAITGSNLQKPMLKYSKRLAAAAKIQYAFREDAEVDNDFILENVAYHDSRWLSKLSGDISRGDFALIFRSFIGGGYQWTQELQDSKTHACVLVRKFVNMMLQMVIQDVAQNPYRKRAKMLVSKFKIDKYIDEETWHLLDSCNFTHVLHRYIKNKPYGLMCAVDKSWPAYDPSIVAEAGPQVYDERVFKNLTSMKIDEIDLNLLKRIGDAVSDVYDNDSVHGWFAGRPYIRVWLDKAVRRSNPEVVKMAKFWIDKLKVVDDLKQKLFDEDDSLLDDLLS